MLFLVWRSLAYGIIASNCMTSLLSALCFFNYYYHHTRYPTGERARLLMLRRSLQLYRRGPLDQKQVSNQYIDHLNASLLACFPY